MGQNAQDRAPSAPSATSASFSSFLFVFGRLPSEADDGVDALYWSGKISSRAMADRNTVIWGRGLGA